MGRFYERLQVQWDFDKFVCVGLDPDMMKILPLGWMESRPYPGDREIIFNYLQSIVDATHDVVCAYKPNWAFFLERGLQGFLALKDIMAYLVGRYPDIPLILDMKVGDIGNTNVGYAQFAFQDLGADAITVHPYMGHQAMAPFLREVDRGVIVLVRTSNEGAGELQGLPIEQWEDPDRPFEVFQGEEPLYKVVARNVRSRWNYNSNCAVVVGATRPEELQHVRYLVGDDIPILIPGVGAQGGSLELAVQNGRNSLSEGFIINASRSVLYPQSPEGQPPVVDVPAAARAEVERMNRVIRQTLFVPPEGNDI